MPRMHKNRSVDVHQFAMVPRAEIPRSSFKIERAYKTTFDGGYLIPVLVEEVLPGDTFRVKMTAFARLATPIFPFMDNLHLESFFFFCPNRLVWSNWVKFMGEQNSPSDSISFTIPQMVSVAGGFPINTVYDYMGLPTVGQVGAGNTVSVNSLPIRAYMMIMNEWFRDENLQNRVTMSNGDGPDAPSAAFLYRRGKRKDYFTGALPWPQKGGVAVSLPLTGNAVVKTSATDLFTGAQEATRLLRTTGAELGQTQYLGVGPAAGDQNQRLWTSLTPAGAAFTNESAYFSNLYADLSTVTATTINALRQSFQIQKLLERDARGGTRYTEIIRSHFGVVSPDARLQRPEYLGGGSTPVNVNPVPQTSNTAAPPTPLGTLSAIGTALASGHGFSQSFTEHGYIIGLINVRADLTYQQGLRRHWSRSTRYDYYFPAFAMLGEQTILNKEIYCDGSATDAQVFGYQERWAELRYSPSEITGLFRSTSAGTLDPWHLSIDFASLPALNATFIQDDPPIDRVIAVPAQPHFLLDCFFEMQATRPLPLFSVPGLIDHF